MSFAVSTEESPKAKIPKILISQASPLLETVTLFVGDASFTLAGGHNYEILEDDDVGNRVGIRNKKGKGYIIHFD